ncbi:GntR family transcriptional regulator [uncultured Thiothrix sp.]|uniref:GntR family transcriptional regulator n=1 Tax=uncultured Thiothrix sp. TaxID=223185 RepID=UPI00262BCD89|nr:GntR family transcriptional regulator [uncultured Thiothrix sp.]
MKKENLYSDLKRQILTMELEPGTSLDETTLSEEYQISRTPLREVFRRLAGEGYLEIVSNRGATVASMSHKTLRNFFMTAPMLYAAVGRLAAMNATPKQIESLRSAQREFRNAALRQDSEGLIFWNDRFHALMGEMAANPYLKPSYDRLLIDHARISQTFYRPHDPDMTHNMQQALDQHDAMIECIVNGQAETMVELIRQHWDLSRSHMERYVRPDPLPIENP